VRILFVSNDDGALYTEVDDLEGFWQLELPEEVVLTAEQLTRGYGQVAEMLIQSGQAKKVE
jgi:hypothetical protein